MGSGGSAEGAGKQAIDLATAVTPEAMIPILANKEVQEKLIPHLPKGESLPETEEELRGTINHPQFQQVCDSFIVNSVKQGTSRLLTKSTVKGRVSYISLMS